MGSVQLATRDRRLVDGYVCGRLVEPVAPSTPHLVAGGEERLSTAARPRSHGCRGRRTTRPTAGKLERVSHERDGLTSTAADATVGRLEWVQVPLDAT